MFTSYERDAESGNDYALARSYVNRLGRFSTPDPLGGSLGDPQSLNRFAYTDNDAINLVDPTGLYLQNEVAYADAYSLWMGMANTYWFWVSTGGYWLETASNGPFHGEPLWQPTGYWDSTTILGFAEWINPTPDPGIGTGILENAAKELSKNKLNKKNCQKDLAALGLTADQVRNGAASANILNGVGSTVSLASLYATSPVPGVRQAGASITGTVGDKLAQPGVVAVSQLGGPDIYVNPALINPTNYYQNLGVAFHEVLHNVSGLTDSDIQRALGLKEEAFTDNITQKLIRDCF